MDKFVTTSSAFRRYYDLIHESGWFDTLFYIEQYPDVARAGIDPILHYLKFGAAEGRNPHPYFDATYYRQQCEALGLRVANPLMHYLLEGRSKGLKTRNESVTPTEVQQGELKYPISRIESSGLFDLGFYNQTNALTFLDSFAGIKHYSDLGWRQGFKPNFYFDLSFYLAENLDVKNSGVEPLFHYLSQGEAEGRRPSEFFDPVWYRARYDISASENSLGNYLSRRHGGRVSPIAEFDVEYYLTSYPDIEQAQVDPFEHFITWGFKEERNPSEKFSTRFYVNRYLNATPDANPFLHYLRHKHLPGVFGAPRPGEPSIPRMVRRFTSRSADFEEVAPLHAAAHRIAKVLAYYLPQFHPFSENDSWWGKGFTEWTNIPRGLPRFEGHYQPRVPRDLGFYSLDDHETLRKQVALAIAAGVFGFIYYYYWFDGRRLMEKPIERMLSDPTIQMPFCLMWANENWTRRWDGAEQEVLIAQTYDSRDDKQLIADFARHFKDPRYIRLQGRPLLMIYRPALIPDTVQVIQRWKAFFKSAYNEQPILVMAQAFEGGDPRQFAFDAAIEFPPHKLTSGLERVNKELQYLDDEFVGNVFAYEDLAAHSLQEDEPPFPLIKTIVPSWDNDARRQGAGMSIHRSSPYKYELWLSELVKRAVHRPVFGEPLVCVNAWNEWCEGAYLEPDLHFGAAYLNATARAVIGSTLRSPAAPSVLLVGHDAFPSGAQHLLLHIGKALKAERGMSVHFLLLHGGRLEADYKDTAPLCVDGNEAGVKQYVDSLLRRGITAAIVNTMAAAHVVPWLKEAGLRTVALCHELPQLIDERQLAEATISAVRHSDAVLFPASTVRDKVLARIGHDGQGRTHVVPQGLYREPDCKLQYRTDIRRSFGMKARQKLVLGIGYGDSRKGFDLFLDVFRGMHTQRPVVHFCWVGDIAPEMLVQVQGTLDDLRLTQTLHLTGYTRDVEQYLSAADAFLLTSREDPFPTVVHEALYAGLPVICFDEAGGMPGFLEEHAMGRVVPFADTNVMAAELKKVLAETQSAEIRGKRRLFVQSKLGFPQYVDQLLRHTFPDLSAVSVAVINYNYAHFLPGRLLSIFQQSYPTSEIVVFDDASSDDSRSVCDTIAVERGRTMRMVWNESNSGSVFKQWKLAAESCSGEYIWIAEADDLAEPAFLAYMVEAMRKDSRIALAFSDSRAINGDGKLLSGSYKPYFSQHAEEALVNSAVYEGADFVKKHLAVRNLILNVSGVLWRREALLVAFERSGQELYRFGVAGDWRLYLEALSSPGTRIAFVEKPLNVHRRHEASVTHALGKVRHLQEIAECQRFAIKTFRLSKKIAARQRKYLRDVSNYLDDGHDNRMAFPLLLAGQIN